MGIYDFDKNYRLCKRCEGCVRRNLDHGEPMYCGGIELWDYKAQGKPGFKCYAGSIDKLALHIK